jgi:hypothetical protein
MRREMTVENAELTVRIFIKGVGLCYQKDNLWKVLFPFDDCHRIKFSSNDISTDAVELAGPERKIEVVVAGGTKLPPAIDESFDLFLNLTDSFAHESGVRMKKGWEANGVLMTIENAVFFAETTENEFTLYEDGKPKKELGIIGHSSYVTINLKENEKLRVLVDGEEIFATTAGIQPTLIFDNDCPHDEQRPGLNDFDMLYNIIEDSDADKRDRKFELLGEVKDSALSNANDALSTQKGKEHSEIFLGERGPATDTVDPLTGKIKPCKIVTADKVDDLA